MQMQETSLEDLSKIYENHMIFDFPKEELRSFKNIKKMYKKGSYFCYTFKDSDDIDAYATFLKSRRNDVLLLDYFAVTSDKRGSGIGSTCINMIPENLNCDGLILECESPEKAKSEDDKLTRERRISFYEKNGVEKTNHKWYVLGVDYDLLWLPINKEKPNIHLGEEVKDMYAQSIPKFFLNFVSSYDTV